MQKAENKKVIIECKNVCKTYKKNIVLQNFNWKIYEGDSIAVIGKNGIGKSTIVEIIAGTKTADSGEIIRSFGNTKKEIAGSIGVQFQESNYPNGVTVKSIIDFYKSIYQNDSFNLNKLIEEFQLEDLQDLPVNRLSGGQQQRLNILLCMVHNPKVLFLDEVSTGLDLEARINIRLFIKALSKKFNWTLIIVTHSIEDINSLCNKVVFMEKTIGIAEEYTIDEIIKKFGSVEKYVQKKFASEGIKEIQVSDFENLNNSNLKKSHLIKTKQTGKVK